uniref:Uncharacterized protein n=1 Tax=Arundo donax TaxID=35708 RepID=A0A0A9JPK3_ARUDO
MILHLILVDVIQSAKNFKSKLLYLNVFVVWHTVNLVYASLMCDV